MTKQRANGEGSIFQRGDGRWVASLSVTEGGKAKRVSVYGKTRAEVRKALRQMQRRIEDNKPARDDAQTLGSWVLRWSRDVLPNSNRRPATCDNYSTLLRVHVVPAMGTVKLGALKPSRIEAFMAELSASRSSSTARACYAALRACLADAVRDGLLAVNPAERVHGPRAAAVAPKALPVAEVRQILQAATGHRLQPFVALLATTGLRRGEGLALRWADLDLQAGTMRVTRNLTRVGGGLTFGEPKTARGRRTVALPSALVDLLRAHKAAQAVERLRVGAAWRDLDLVFTTEDGGPLEPRNVSRWYAGVATRAGVSETGLHALRHSAATAMLTAGVPVRTVADTLGHADVSMTLNVYAATLDDQAARATNAVADALALGAV